MQTMEREPNMIPHALRALFLLRLAALLALTDAEMDSMIRLVCVCVCDL